jgi:hypothetical protein
LLGLGGAPAFGKVVTLAAQRQGLAIAVLG